VVVTVAAVGLPVAADLTRAKRADTEEAPVLLAELPPNGGSWGVTRPIPIPPCSTAGRPTRGSG
jgi:hypothetical protein